MIYKEERWESSITRDWNKKESQRPRCITERADREIFEAGKNVLKCRLKLGNLPGKYANGNQSG